MPNPLDCGGICSAFPRMTVGYILVGKYFSKHLWASSIPLRKQCCDTSGREILGKLQEVCGGRDTFGTSGSEWLLKKAEVVLRMRFSRNSGLWWRCSWIFQINNWGIPQNPQYLKPLSWIEDTPQQWPKPKYSETLGTYQIYFYPFLTYTHHNLNQ